MYDIGLNMGIADTAILATLEKLQAKQGSFGYEEIANAVPCSPRTVASVVPKLIESGKVRRLGAKRNKSIRYEIIK